MTRSLSAIACVNYSTASNHDNFYACANGINDGKYAYNNLQHYDGTWYHRFNAKWHMATEAWYMYEREVPNVAGNVVNPVPTELGANGAYCAAGQLRCTAPEYAFVNYVNREFNSKLSVGIPFGPAGRQEGAAYGDSWQVHGEHAVCDEVHRQHSDVAAGAAVRSLVGRAGIRQWNGAEPVLLWDGLDL